MNEATGPVRSAISRRLLAGDAAGVEERTTSSTAANWARQIEDGIADRKQAWWRRRRAELDKLILATRLNGYTHSPHYPAFAAVTL